MGHTAITTTGVKYLKGPGKSAFIVFVITSFKWPLNTELSNFTSIIKQKHRIINEHNNNKRPTAHSGQFSGSNKKSPLN